MINELKTLSDAIKTAGFDGTDWENKFGEIKLTSPCFILELTDEGTIADIRFLAPEKAKVLRTWTGGSNGASFPAFNFQPFFSGRFVAYLSLESIKRRLKAIAVDCRFSIANFGGQWYNTPRWRMQGCLHFVMVFSGVIIWKNSESILMSQK